MTRKNRGKNHTRHITMIPCGECGLQVEGDQQNFITCSTCGAAIHGKEVNSKCSGLASSTWLNMSPSDRAKWKCFSCRRNCVTLESGAGKSNNNNNRPKRRATSPPEDSMSSQTDSAGGPLSNELVAFGNRLLTQFTAALNEKVDPLGNNVAKLTEDFSSFQSTILNHKSRIETLETAVDNYSQKEAEWTAQKSELVSRMNNLEKSNQLLLDRAEAAENYSRRNNVIIRGLPIWKEEDPFSVAVKAASIVGVKISPGDIVDCHRLPSRNQHPDQSQPFIIKFVNRATTRDVVAGYKRVKPTAVSVGGNPEVKLFADFDHAPNTSFLLRKARTLRSAGFSAPRVKAGSVYVKLNVRGATEVRVCSIEDIDKLRGTDSSSVNDL